MLQVLERLAPYAGHHDIATDIVNGLQHNAIWMFQPFDNNSYNIILLQANV